MRQWTKSSLVHSYNGLSPLFTQTITGYNNDLNQTTRNKVLLQLNHYTEYIFQENGMKNISKISAILFRPNFVKILHYINCELLTGRKQRVSLAHRENLPYTEAVLHEAMRIYPVAPLALPRETSCDVELRTCMYSNMRMRWRLLSGVPDFFDRNKFLSGGDMSHYQVPHCIKVFFYFVRFVFIHHNFQFYFELCTYCNILDIYQS